MPPTPPASNTILMRVQLTLHSCFLTVHCSDHVPHPELIGPIGSLCPPQAKAKPPPLKHVLP